jgi:autotransporter-associated beta strand protein
VANGGSNGGGGGTILFADDSTGSAARVEVFGNGSLDISFHNAPHGRAPAMAVGSIEGDGYVFLGANKLTLGNNNTSTTFSGVIQDGGANGGVGGSLTKVGSGTLALSGANTYSGNTNINGGVLKVGGSITSNTLVNAKGTLAGTGTIHGNVTNNFFGTVSPGDAPGTLTVNSYTQGRSGTLLIDIAGSTTGQLSVLDVLGNASLGGVLDPVLQNGFIPTIGESFNFMYYSGLTGAFVGIQEPTFDNGLEHWSVTYQPAYAILTVESGPGGPGVTVPDPASTLLLLTLSLLGLVMCQLLRKPARV